MGWVRDAANWDIAKKGYKKRQDPFRPCLGLFLKKEWYQFLFRRQPRRPRPRRPLPRSRAEAGMGTMLMASSPAIPEDEENDNTVDAELAVKVKVCSHQ